MRTAAGVERVGEVVVMGPEDPDGREGAHDALDVVRVNRRPEMPQRNRSTPRSRISSSIRSAEPGGRCSSGGTSRRTQRRDGTRSPRVVAFDSGCAVPLGGLTTLAHVAVHSLVTHAHEDLMSSPVPGRRRVRANAGDRASAPDRTVAGTAAFRCGLCKWRICCGKDLALGCCRDSRMRGHGTIRSTRRRSSRGAQMCGSLRAVRPPSCGTCRTP